MARQQTIGYVNSSTDNSKQYTIIRRVNGRWECSCPQFFHGDRLTPCKHINGMRLMSPRVEPGRMTLKKVKLTKGGQKILANYRRRHGGRPARDGQRHQRAGRRRVERHAGQL